MSEQVNHASVMLELAQRYPALAKHQPSLCYAAGGVAMLRLYAWWRDGQQWVGCGVKTLATAEREWIEENIPTGPTTTEQNNHD